MVVEQFEILFFGFSKTTYPPLLAEIKAQGDEKSLYDLSLNLLQSEPHLACFRINLTNLARYKVAYKKKGTIVERNGIQPKKLLPPPLLGSTPTNLIPKLKVSFKANLANPVVIALNEDISEEERAKIIKDFLLSESQSQFLDKYSLTVLDLLHGKYPYMLGPNISELFFQVWNKDLKTPYFQESSQIPGLVRAVQTGLNRHIEDIQFN